jgi:hypothetical protein
MDRRMVKLSMNNHGEPDCNCLDTSAQLPELAPNDAILAAPATQLTPASLHEAIPTVPELTPKRASTRRDSSPQLPNLHLNEPPRILAAELPSYLSVHPSDPLQAVVVLKKQCYGHDGQDNKTIRF